MSVQGPPPALRTGCDMVVVFPLMLEPAALEILAGAGLRPERIATADEALLEPVASRPIGEKPLPAIISEP